MRVFFLKFVVIGVCNTALDAVLFWTLIQVTSLPNPVSRVTSFLAANAFSYFANSVWNFKTPVNRHLYARFLWTSGIGAGLAYAITAAGDSAGLHPMISFLVSVIILPPLNFAIMRKFVFSGKK